MALAVAEKGLIVNEQSRQDVKSGDTVSFWRALAVLTGLVALSFAVLGGIAFSRSSSLWPDWAGGAAVLAAISGASAARAVRLGRRAG